MNSIPSLPKRLLFLIASSRKPSSVHTKSRREAVTAFSTSTSRSTLRTPPVFSLPVAVYGRLHKKSATIAPSLETASYLIEPFATGRDRSSKMWPGNRDASC